MREIKPCGPVVIVEVVPVDDKYEGTTIVRPTIETKREHGGRDIGYVRAIGPTAYSSLAGCESAEHWGVKIGDLVEFNRYDGKIPRGSELYEKIIVEGKEIESKNLRLVHDNDIIASYGATQ